MKSFIEIFQEKKIDDEDALTTEVKNFLSFKLKQWRRTNGVDIKDENIKEILKDAMQKNLKQWTAEALKAIKS